MYALTHKSSHEVWGLIRHCWSEDSCNISIMFSTDDRVLVFIAYAAVVGEGFGEPVGRADEGCLSVDILIGCQRLGLGS